MGASTPTVVVTGATGFIGKAVCKALLDRGIVVYGVTRRSHVAVVPGVIMQSAVSYEHFDAPRDAICVHCAGETDPVTFARGGESAYEMHCASARAIAHYGFSRVVFTSSSLVYGEENTTAHREDEQCTPKSIYARMKYDSEQIFLACEGVIARLANVYGIGLSPVNVISDILKQIPGEGALTVRDARPIRDYIHVNDVAQGLVRLALGSPKGIFNIGTGHGTSVRELAQQLLLAAHEERREVVSSSSSSGSISTVILNPEKMRQEFDWRATVVLKDGLRALMQYHVNKAYL